MTKRTGQDKTTKDIFKEVRGEINKLHDQKIDLLVDKQMTAKEFLKDAEPVYLAMYAELAKRVGMTLDKLELLEDIDGWRWPYEKYSWTVDEEDDFEAWLLNYMYKHRKELDMRYATKKYIKSKVVPMWMLMFSWRNNESL